MNERFCIFLYCLLGLCGVTAAQIRLEVVNVAPFITENKRIFLAADFNHWEPGGLNYELTRQENGTYFINLPDTLTQFKYKFTQGSWGLVEGNADRSSRADRSYNKNAAASPKLVRDTISGWEAKPTYRFVVNKLPANTPKDAILYITGNFNNWNPADESYRLQRQIDNTFRISVVSDLERFEYKFTRGDWENVEGLENGKARPNRVLFRSTINKIDNIPVEIISWEDLSGTFNFFSLYDLLLLFSAFQCLLLIVAIPSIQDYNRKANLWLVISIAFIAVMVGIRVVSDYKDVAQTYTKMLLIPDFALFLYAPLFFFYIRKLLFKTPTLPDKWWLHFLLPLAQLLAYMPFFLSEKKVLQLKIVNHSPDLQMLYIISGIIALGSNTWYWFQCRNMIFTYKRQYTTLASDEQNLQYLSTVLIIQAVCLVFWLFSGVLSAVGNFFPFDTSYITSRSVDFIWLVFSLIPYFLGYFAIHQPEIFKIASDHTTPFFSVEEVVNAASDGLAIPGNEKTPDISDQNLQEWKEKIGTYMQKSKPHHNPGLTLGTLAAKVKISPHLLSKVINEAYEKNFFDFVNSYRIEDFKERFEDPRNKHFTMLAIAFEVGFNSKTAFNRAFKKMTGSTPREYFFESRLED
ncbi:MAG: helix-turn-helix domain-containing protein [Dyadobacter sp.]|uniref:helix-turn-helix domain-containing protein n=1 Tax=Dyadobacter sp. TaxID=1914288 RepID=UPI00326398F9